MNVQQKVWAAFSKRYPGIQIETFKIQPAPAIERAVTEAKAGLHNVDVIDPNISYLPLLLDRDMLESYPWDKVFGIAPAQLLFDNKAIVIADYDYPISYNTDLVPAGAIKSWEDVLDPKWRGKVLIEARGIPFHILATKWGEERTADFIKRLLTNQPIITQGSTLATDSLAGGRGAISIASIGGRIQLAIDAGAPVEWARVGPIPSLTVVITPIKGAPHPNAAKLWSAFWATEEAQNIFYQEQRFGFLAGEPLSPHGKELRAAGIEVLREPTNLAEGQRLLEKVGALVSGRR